MTRHGSFRLSLTFFASKHSPWSRQVGREVALTLSDDERKRQENIFEFLETWQSYVGQLDRLLQNFLLPLHRDGLIPEIETFTDTVKLIHEHARAANEILRQIRSQVIFSIGPVINDVVDDLPLKAYSQFCRTLHSSSEILRERASANSRIQQMAQSFALEHDALGVYSSLCLPFQRLLKIQLIIRSITKVTRDDHPDKLVLITTDKKHCENLNHLNLQMLMPVPLRQNSRWWRFW